MSDQEKLYRCMGGKHCNHIPGSCTATNTTYQGRISPAFVDHPPTSSPVVDHETGNTSDKVTQADRELLIRIMGYDSETIDDILAGNAFTWEVEQIARHRQATRAALVAEIVAWLEDYEPLLGDKIAAKWGRS